MGNLQDILNTETHLYKLQSLALLFSSEKHMTINLTDW